MIHPPIASVSVATGALVGIPLVAGVALHVSLRPGPGLPVVLAVAIGIALAVAMVGQTVWARRPESAHFSLGDLMVWNAMRRRSAERRVERKAHLLGFDLEGRFAGHVRVPLEQQLAIAREISRALEIKSTYSRNHSRRVERQVRRMAVALGLSPSESEQLAIAAALHDIGNIQVPDHLLRKPGDLTQEERDAIEGHVLLGAAMAFTAGSVEVVEAIRHHHERWDGSGYPSRLVGEEIPLFARAVAIAAAFEAMTSPRPYRRSFTRDHALDVIRSQAGAQFDPNLVEVFVSTLPEQKTAGLAPLLAFPLSAGRGVASSIRRMGAGGVAATMAGATAAILLGTAIVSPGTFRLPAETHAPTAVSTLNGGPVVVDVAVPDVGEASTDEGNDTRSGGDAGAPEVADAVLGTRFVRTDPPSTDPGDPPAPEPEPSSPGPGPGPDPEPSGPSPSPDPGGGLPGPAVGEGPTPSYPGVPSIPGTGGNEAEDDKDKRGHAYGHDHGPGHPGQVHGKGHGGGDHVPPGQQKRDEEGPAASGPPSSPSNGHGNNGHGPPGHSGNGNGKGKGKG